MKTLKKSSLIALCGMIASLSVVLMFATGLFPFATYAIPAFAGILLIAIAVECGTGWAMLAFVAVSLISLFVTPDREAAIMFIFFFGHYPILRFPINRIRPKALSVIVKFLLFNACVIAGYLVIINVFGIDDVLEGMGDFGKYSPYVLLGLGNIVFIAYDIALDRLSALYINVFRVRFLRRFNRR